MMFAVVGNKVRPGKGVWIGANDLSMEGMYSGVHVGGGENYDFVNIEF